MSPGNEQRDYWGSDSADQQGGGNLMGVKNKAIDTLVGMVINTPDRRTLVTRVHALDRVLLHSYYVIPNWYLNYFRVASWNKFGRPQENPPYALALDAWWYDAAQAQQVEARKAQVQKQ
jgi:microcin C transport system substrate-binding protein